MTPRKIKWPVQFAGFAIAATILVWATSHGHGQAGIMGAVGGALLAAGGLGLAWFGARKLLAVLLKRMVRWAVDELQRRGETAMLPPEDGE